MTKSTARPGTGLCAYAILPQGKESFGTRPAPNVPKGQYAWPRQWFYGGAMKNLRIIAVVLAIAPIAAGAGLTACGRTNEAGGEVVPASAVGLDVKNQNFLDV